MGIANLAASLRNRFDSWQSSLTGLGGGRDKSTSLLPYRREELTEEQIETLLDFDDMAMILCEAEPEAMFREGFEVRTGDVGINQRMHDVIERLEVCKAWTDALVAEAGYGGALIIIGCRDGFAAEQPLNLPTLERVEYLLVVDRRDARALQWDENPLSPRFGKPTLYEITNAHRSSGAGATQGKRIAVHWTRTVAFEGGRCSSMLKRARQGWGQSRLDRSFRALQMFHGNWASIANILTDASQGVFKIPDLWDIMTGPDRAQLEVRAEVMDMGRSVARAIFLDEKESFERKDTSMSGLPEMLDRTSHRLAASARMPVAILMGREPSGLNATGESDVRAWYDNVKAKRTQRVEPQLRTLMRLIFLSSKGPTAGQIPESWSLYWPPMWQSSPMEKAQIYSTLSTADASLVAAGILTAPEIATRRFGPEGYQEELNIDTSHYQAELDTLNAKIASGEGELAPTPADLGDAIKALRGQP